MDHMVVLENFWRFKHINTEKTKNISTNLYIRAH